MLAPRGLKWDASADVAIVGCGGAGVVAAVTAREAGADVLVLEKQPERSHHTNTSMAGGLFLTPSDVKGGVDYLEALYDAGHGMLWTDKEIIRVWAEYAVDNKRWFEARGGSFLDTAYPAEYPEMPAHKTLARYRFRGAGLGLGKFLSELIKAKNIPVMYETPAAKLLTDLEGRVIGVEADQRLDSEVKKLRVRASKAVILTCGGFEYDERMKLHYHKVYPTYFTGTTANTGDGIRMAMDVGADLWHMNCVAAQVVMKFPDFPVAFAAAFVPGPRLSPLPDASTVRPQDQCGYVFVDRDGKRFADERRFRTDPPRHAIYYEMALYDGRRLVYPRVPSYWIFDSRRIDLGPLPGRHSGPAGPTGLYDWSKDNSREIEKGWIVTANTVRELAGKINVPPDVLEDTLLKFNRYCEKGADPDFGRHSSDLMPVDKPPYGAVKLWPGGPNTQGGPRRNAKAEVLNCDGDPIAGLYSAGELGSIYGMLYTGAGNLTECVAFGRIAGENAARGEAQ
ncbi:MAG: FAD-binding protein [Chloroflexi bacterium]|nr:FAD-binding protein [Chloroflexota bacterium]